jgi:hypothetical protein
MSQKDRELLTPALLVLLCIAAFFGVFIRPGLEDRGRESLQTAFDYQSYFLPRFTLTSAELFKGHLPTWNAFEYGGIPLLATSQAAALYLPKALLFGILPEETAIWVFLIFHFVLHAGTFLLFLRHHGITGVAAFVGTALWVFTSLMLLGGYAPIRIANLAWMPLFFLFAERIVQGGGRRAFAGLAVVVAMQLFAGYPEFAIDTSFLFGIHATVSWFTRRWQSPPWKTLPILGAAFVLGAVVAGAQLIPLAELAQVAQRNQFASAAYNEQASLLHGLLTVVPGLIPFVFVGFASRRAREASAGMITCWIIGNGGWRYLRLLPGFSMIRFPLCWVLLSSFYLAWLGALGCEAVLRSGGDVGPRVRKVAQWFLAACGVLVAIVWGAEGLRSPTKAMLAKEELLRYLGTPSAVVLGVLGGALLTTSVVLTLRRRTVPALWFTALVSLTLSHVAATPFGGIPSPLVRPFKTGLAARLHGRPRLIKGRVLCLEDLLYGYEIADRLPSPLGIEFSFIPYRYRQLLTTLKFIPLFAQIDWPKLAAASGFLDAMDVQFVAAHESIGPVLLSHDFDLIRRAGEYALFRNPDRMGHAWVNYAVRHAGSEAEALEYVLSPSFDPHREVLLEGPTTGTYPARTDAPVTFPKAERRASLTDVEFSVELDRPGVFVMSESAYPGWIATLDGKPATWIQADYVLRAVEVGPGQHRVRFQYRPASVRIGLFSTALGLVLVGLLLAPLPRRRIT